MGILSARHTTAFVTLACVSAMLTGCGSDSDDKSATAEGSRQTSAGNQSSTATQPGTTPVPATSPSQGQDAGPGESPPAPVVTNGSVAGQTLDGDPAPYIMPNLAETDEPSVPAADDTAASTEDTQEVTVNTPAGQSSAATARSGPAAAARTGAGTTTPKHILQKYISSNPSGFRWNSVMASHLYGPGLFTQTTLANTIIGVYKGVENVVVNRFRALEGGQLSRVRLYWQGGEGYSAGTGGRIRLTVLPDDNTARHLPDFSQQPLAEASFVPDMHAGNSIFPEIALTSHGTLQKGKIYHLVMQNTDANPAANYVSSNNAATHMQITRPSRWISSTDWGTLMGKRTPGSSTFSRWMNLTHDGSGNHFFSPILQLTFADGKSMGVSDMESGSVDPGRVYTVTSQKPVRERFVPGAEKRVNAISVATAASKAGQLKWRLLQGSRELAWGYIKAASPNYRTVEAKGLQLAALKWYDIIFPPGQYVELSAGKPYDLKFRAEGSSEWKFADHRNGASSGFTWPAAFTESQAQHLDGGRWLDTNHWNYHASKKGSNWPVVFHLDPAD